MKTPVKASLAVGLFIYDRLTVCLYYGITFVQTGVLFKALKKEEEVL
jgi:hypothetical protein